AKTTCATRATSFEVRKLSSVLPPPVPPRPTSPATMNAAHHHPTSCDRRRVRQSVWLWAAVSALCQRSCITRAGITRLAKGMNQPPMLQPDVYRSWVRPRASAFLTLRHCHTMNTTAVTRTTTRRATLAEFTRSSAWRACATVAVPFSAASITDSRCPSTPAKVNDAAAHATNRPVSVLRSPLVARHRIPESRWLIISGLPLQSEWALRSMPWLPRQRSPSHQWRWPRRQSLPRQVRFSLVPHSGVRCSSRRVNEGFEDTADRLDNLSLELRGQRPTPTQVSRDRRLRLAQLRVVTRGRCRRTKLDLHDRLLVRDHRHRRRRGTRHDRQGRVLLERAFEKRLDGLLLR